LQEIHEHLDAQDQKIERILEQLEGKT
jgi:hypothetical protein